MIFSPVNLTFYVIPSWLFQVEHSTPPQAVHVSAGVAPWRLRGQLFLLQRSFSAQQVLILACFSCPERLWLCQWILPALSSRTPVPDKEISQGKDVEGKGLG